MSSTSTIAISSIATEDFSTWNIDPAHSAAEFKVRHMMISNVKGKFSGLSGMLKLDETDYAHSTVEVSIPASVRTVDEKLDAHLKAEDFFDVEKFPTLTFRSTSIRYTGGQDYAVTGDLTIRGVTRSVAEHRSGGRRSGDHAGCAIHQGMRSKPSAACGCRFGRPESSGQTPSRTSSREESSWRKV
jgi:polyisoprenoid-binding protein YceI